MPRLYSVNLGGGSGSGVLVVRSGQETIADATQVVSITFSSAMLDTSYAVQFSILNLVDADPIYLQGIITNKAVGGFDIEFNSPTDSANYIIDYQVSAYV